jgi:hypothetical protein
VAALQEEVGAALEVVLIMWEARGAHGVDREQHARAKGWIGLHHTAASQGSSLLVSELHPKQMATGVCT